MHGIVGLIEFGRLLLVRDGHLGLCFANALLVEFLALCLLPLFHLIINERATTCCTS